MKINPKGLLLVGIAAVIMTGCSGNADIEHSWEMADLQGMRGAELTAKLLWKAELPDGTLEYWYDPDEHELIQSSDPKPDSKGLGTAKVGGAVKDFETETGFHYEYDESADYTDKIIHVIVRNDKNSLDVKVDWTDAE